MKRFSFISVGLSRLMVGLVLAAVSIALCYTLTGKLKAGMVFAVLFLLSGAIRIKEEAVSGEVRKLLYLVWLLLAAFATGFFSQLILGQSFLATGAMNIAFTMCICFIAFFCVYAITLRPVFSVGLIMAASAIFSFVNYCVFAFRGNELQPSDLLSIRTAGNVAAKYRVVITNTALYGFILTVLFIFSSLALPALKPKKKVRARMLSALAAILLFSAFLPVSKGISPRHFLADGSVINGFLLNFTLQIRETFVSKPDGYSVDGVEDVAKEYENKDAISVEIEDSPDIIVIMDESFADLSVLGAELNTNTEVTPFIDSLTENTIKGYALSSVYGGGTPNSEYEFLSGNTMMFLPAGSIVYQQYLKQPSYSMVAEMKENGYKCVAMHPYLSSGWVRTSVYPYLGFDECHFIDDFSDEHMERDFISDRGMFERLIELYEDNKAADQDVFMFGVTMQNHSGYEYVGDNYRQTVLLEGYHQDYDDVEQYLSLIHETDDAMKFLLGYFSKVKDNVVVVFYGDHLPHLNPAFYEEVHCGTFDALDEQQLKYTVPFFVWTNYDIDEETVELTSLNYLSNYVYQAAGLALPEYNRVLLDIQKEIPAMNANGFYSLTQGRFVAYKEATGDEKEILNLYNQLEYNCMFDPDGRNEILFPLPAGKA